MSSSALAPWISFRYTMPTLVAPYPFFWHPDRCVPPLPPAFLLQPLYPAPSSMPRGRRPPAPFSLQRTMFDRSSPSQDSPCPALEAGRGGALRWGPFPMFLMDIAHSDDVDWLLRDLDMLKDDVLEAADEAARAPDPALCDALRWIAADGTIQAITAVTGAWVPRGLLLTATVTVATGPCPSEVKIIESVPLALAQGGPVLQYVSKDPDTLTAAWITMWSPGHSPISAARLRHIVFRNLYSTREKAPPTDTQAVPDIQNQKVSFKARKPISHFLPPHLRPTGDYLRA